MTEGMPPGAPLTGHPGIDREHRELLRCIAEFDRARQAADGHDGAVKALHFLLHHAITHFRSEEDQMETMGYPDLESHRHEHARLLEEVRGLLAQFHEMNVPAGIVARFSERILRHLAVGDRRFADWVNSRLTGENEKGRAIP